MPQELILMTHIDTGEPVYMHSVDAAEAARLGDYMYPEDEGKDLSPQQRQMARARTQGMTAPAHMELLSPEERQRVRQEANDHARQMAEALHQPSLMPQEAGARTMPVQRTMGESAPHTTGGRHATTSPSHAPRSTAHEDDKK